MNNEKADALVIGAGPAGVMAAAELHKNGLKTIVVEKQTFPRFVIGESLLPRCMDHFENGGFLDALTKAGFQKKTGAKFVRGDRACIFDFSEQFTRGWTSTWQVTRADFDKVLADELAKRGVPVHYEEEVKNVEFTGTDSVTTVADSSGKQSRIEARFIVDASGYGRVLPRLLNLDKPSDFPQREALFSHVKDIHRPQEDAHRIVCFVPVREVFTWAIPFSNGTTSIGFTGSPEYLNKFQGTPGERLQAMIDSDPNIRDRFGKAEFIFEPRAIKGFAVGIKKMFGDGYVLAGNSTEFLDPIFSSGVALATESGTLAGRLASRQLKGGSVDWQGEYADYVMDGINTFRTYVTAWYDGTLQEIFFSQRKTKAIIEQITSILAGYVWDKTNPFAKKSDQALTSLVRLVRMGMEVS